MFEIQSGLPVPNRRMKEPKYPFYKMEVGDSFAYPPNMHVSIYAYASNFKKNTTKKFAFRQIGDECRVWRIE